MAVITKFVVVRNGVELDNEFLVKKEAEAYDKMLDAAENLAAFIRDGDLKVALEAGIIDAIAVFLAKNGPEVTRILKGLKPIRPALEKPTEPKERLKEKSAKKKPAAKTKPKG